MSAPLILLGYAVLVGTLGARALQRSSWPDRSPAVGIIAWQALTMSVLMSLVLAGAVLALPRLPITPDLAELIQACSVALQAHYSTPGGAAVALAGAVLAVGVISRVAYCLTAEWVGTGRRRAEQRRAVDLLARSDDPSRSALVIEHAIPLAYCVPGRGGRVVLTSGTFGALAHEEVAAVLAHEEAHLRGRHHLVLGSACAVASAFPFVRAFRTAQTELERLVEMHADDSALRVTERRVLATALVSLAGGSHPMGTLGAAGASALARVERLAGPGRPLGRFPRILIVVGSGAVLLLPMVVAASPAVAAAAMDYCPVGFPM